MTQSENRERRERILSAATNLFIHYGYDKTTVSDIARESGVSKGAIYLHFESKDALMEALIVRESLVYNSSWLEKIEADPLGGTIGGMYKNILLALDSSPFMAAIIRQDGRVLGNYLRKPDNIFRKNKNKNGRYEFVKMMQEAGAIRPDVDPHVASHIMNLLAFSLGGIGEIYDVDEMPPTADTINGIADMMDRYLSPADGGNSEGGKAVIKALIAAAKQSYDIE